MCNMYMHEPHAHYTQFAFYEYLITTDRNAVSTVTLKIHTLSSEQVEPYRIDLCTCVHDEHESVYITCMYLRLYTHLLVAQ